ncbi:MAG: NTP transferase domain-containing protein, partial [Acidobacteriota bacterium]
MNADNALSGTDVLVLAGGMGTRLKSVIGDHPKVLAQIDGQPFLFYLLDHLRVQGVQHVVLSLGYAHQEVLDCLKGRPVTTPRVTTVVEKTPLGTAGAIRFASP